MVGKMSYILEKISYIDKTWYACLLVEGVGGRPRNVQIWLKNAHGQKYSPDYRIVNNGHQIDDRGMLFLSTCENQRWGAMKGLHPLAVRYATQYDFDKFCFENPNSRLSFDWNAEVFRAFVSVWPGVYTPASNSDGP